MNNSTPSPQFTASQQHNQIMLLTAPFKDPIGNEFLTVSPIVPSQREVIPHQEIADMLAYQQQISEIPQFTSLQPQSSFIYQNDPSSHVSSDYDPSATNLPIKNNSSTTLISLSPVATPSYPEFYQNQYQHEYSNPALISPQLEFYNFPMNLSSKPKSQQKRSTNSRTATLKHHCQWPDCSWSFRRLEHLKRHMLTHTGERKYLCDFPGCNKRFGRSDNFAAHRKIHQRNDPTFVPRFYQKCREEPTKGRENNSSKQHTGSNNGSNTNVETRQIYDPQLDTQLVNFFPEQSPPNKFNLSIAQSKQLTSNSCLANKIIEPEKSKKIPMKQTFRTDSKLFRKEKLIFNHFNPTARHQPQISNTLCESSAIITPTSPIVHATSGFNDGYFSIHKSSAAAIAPELLSLDLLPNIEQSSSLNNSMIFDSNSISTKFEFNPASDLYLPGGGIMNNYPSPPNDPNSEFENNEQYTNSRFECNDNPQYPAWYTGFDGSFMEDLHDPRFQNDTDTHVTRHDQNSYIIYESFLDNGISMKKVTARLLENLFQWMDGWMDDLRCRNSTQAE
ncbi:hypothetical protein G9A89_007234 [Geosiphon pyriformis]|nr:hypothetical protein G9A89_007234 [Geosiphon pyriformis]